MSRDTYFTSHINLSNLWTILTFTTNLCVDSAHIIHDDVLLQNFTGA